MQIPFEFEVNNAPLFKKKLLHWCSRFSSFSFLNSNGYELPHSQADVLVGAGVTHQITVDIQTGLESLELFFTLHQQRFVFGHIGYGVTAGTMQVTLLQPQANDFANLSFFVPQHVIKLGTKSATIYANDFTAASALFDTIVSVEPRHEDFKKISTAKSFQPVISRDEYLKTLDKLLQHIHRGDCYEINFCQQFVAELDAHIDALWLYEKLDRQSPNPFGGLYRRNSDWLLCASPERFVQRNGMELISQPIKGTSKRKSQQFHSSEDERLQLSASEKDRAENVMVVDLVRNDLSRVCQPGTVKVKELFGIYTFPQVHQMISTITGQLKANVSLTEIIKTCFPMGSMTGAPKKRVVELIHEHEATARGIYSGAIGYISPNGDFDFNVVIRSMVYNQAAKRLHFHVGGGITAYSIPENEYEECLIKAEPLLNLLP